MSMIQLQRSLDAIIGSLKASPGFDDVRFVREYGNQYIDNPISGFLAAVRVKSFGISESYLGGLATGTVSGDTGFAEVEIALYAPKNKNGSGLSKIIGDMLTAINGLDAGVMITELRAGSIEFDLNLCAVFRRLGFRMEFCAGDEDDE